MSLSIFNILFNGIMDLVQNGLNFMVAPILDGILILFPSFSVILTHYMSFMTYALHYLPTIKYLLLFTDDMFIFLFDYYAIKFTIFVLTSNFRFGLKLYNILKI